MLPMSLAMQLSRYVALYLAPWVLTMMTTLTPNAPWSDSYPETAVAIAQAAEEYPCAEEQGGAWCRAAQLTALAKFESEFDANAVGDSGQSFGAFQVSKAFAPAAELLDPVRGARMAARLIARSEYICRGRPAADRLAWYVAGGAGCSQEPRALSKSRHRVDLGAKLFRERPDPETDWED